ncbi:MAG TPA: hypothetical protein VHE55_14660 [Fimbriimonadaceae bacterium]|nr:hypothetical protein [Fimbriimonadaceae bacterium]
MKLVWLAILLLPALVLGQQRPGVWDSAFRFVTDSADIASGKSAFLESRTDIIVQVKKHQFGADLFEITAVKPNYPADLLHSQVETMCSLIGVPARGLRVGSVGIAGSPRLTSTRATFATDGVIDRARGVLRVSPIIQAFAGAPEPYTINGISILFNGENPTPNTLRTYNGPGVRLQAIAMENPALIEYRVQLLSQDPKEVAVPDVPEPQSEQKARPTASTVQQNGVDWSLWIPLCVGAVAAGTLVYFLMLRASGKPRG